MGVGDGKPEGGTVVPAVGGAVGGMVGGRRRGRGHDRRRQTAARSPVRALMVAADEARRVRIGQPGQQALEPQVDGGQRLERRDDRNRGSSPGRLVPQLEVVGLIDLVSGAAL